MTVHHFRIGLNVVAMIAIAYILWGCKTSEKEPFRVNMPGAYQFCIDNPEHEECVDEG